VGIGTRNLVLSEVEGEEVGTVKLVWCVALVALMGSAAAAGDVAGAAATTAQAGSAAAAEVISGFINANHGAGLYMIYGRDATGIGPGLEWQMFKGCRWLRFNLIAAASSAGSERLIPGVGALLPGGGDKPELTMGVCWTPGEYGAARIGGLKTNAAVYLGLRVRI
jgi:hypothetical protein